MPKSEKFQQLPAPWDRIFSMGTRTVVWAILIGIIYLLRPFFLLIFLTFVFAYIQSHCVEGLQHRIKNRVGRVVIIFSVFLGLIVGTFYFLAPHVKNQMQEFGSNYPRYMEQADDAIYKWVDDYPALKKILAEEEPAKPESTNGGAPPETRPVKEAGTPQVPVKRKPILAPLVSDLVGLGDTGEKVATIEHRLETLKHTASGILGVTSSFLLAILFSFLIVLDLPSLSRGVQGLQRTRLDFIYDEVAENIHHFGKRLGRALEAQLFIAICNTILTAIGIYFLGIPSLVFLATIVFFCSFIPVAGVFISSAPICLLALQTGGDSGMQLMVVAIIMILIIHTIEAYILNPKIYGHHLRMNAVLVLIVLTIAGKLVGVWGLVLGLPVVNYVFTTAIRRDADQSETGEGGEPKPAGSAGP